jgi:hypothetical protein
MEIGEAIHGEIIVKLKSKLLEKWQWHGDGP